ncbi:uncharacterized protein C2845_PM08G03740 [Panicum miliaceum]|uniref:Uncharacterized protein n=1 Tax=Panicum miliaceum TaxID=4540 RepID=A0A3L6R0J0_PANMI|nr:uncharacterized protein C2845_PM08G03740 [Panicum miliaceum]
MGDGNSPPGPAVSRPTPSEEDYGSWTWKQKFEDLIGCDPSPKHPDSASYFKEKLQDMFGKYLRTVCPKPRPVFEKDSVKQFYQVCTGWSHFMGLREFLYPEILSTMTSSYNALRCARVALKGAAPLRGRRADPNGLHRYGFTPLHLAAKNFSVDMVKLLFRHGASANIRTKGEDVVEGLLPLHVAVENASMHKYLEDHWANGDHIVSLIFLLCLPEMKMFLDTTRLIAKQTDSIVDEVWNYIRTEKLVEAAILLLAAGLAMVKEGENGKALQMLQNKKEALLTAHALVGIIQKVGEALEGYIQTYPEVSHEEIVEHVSSILTSSGIVYSGKGIDTGNLEWFGINWDHIYQYGAMPIDRSRSESGDCEKTNEADKASSLEDEVSKRILIKHPPKGLAIKEVRNMFFPYWKSVLSCRFMVKIAPACQPSRKDLLSAEASKKGTEIDGKSWLDECAQFVLPRSEQWRPRRAVDARGEASGGAVRFEFRDEVFIMQKPVAATTNPSARHAGPRLPIDEPRRGPDCSASHRHRCRRPRQHVPGRTKV